MLFADCHVLSGWEVMVTHNGNSRNQHCLLFVHAVFVIAEGGAKIAIVTRIKNIKNVAR